MTLAIAGIGTAVPPHRIAQDDAARIAFQLFGYEPQHERLLRALYRRTTVATRHSVLLERPDGELLNRQSFYPAAHGTDDGGPTTAERMQRYAAEAAPLAVAAAAAALGDAEIKSDRVTHLVTVSCSGFDAPGFDLAMIDALRLSPGVARTHVGFMGCHGALNALRVARAFVEADPRACVLLCAVELCSLHHCYGWDPEKVVANALFADGAAAAVGVSGKTSSCWNLVASGSTVVADSADAMTWRIGDHGFEMGLSPRVPDLIATRVRPWLEVWLSEQDLSAAAVGSWAVHPGGPKILSAFMEAMDLDRAALAPSQQVLAEYGNMSSPTLLFILDRLRRTQARRPCVAVGFGPGLSIEAALFRD